MADDLTKEQRRKNMQHIRSNDTKIEVLLRKALWNRGYRYRKNYRDLPGKPDIGKFMLFIIYQAGVSEKWGSPDTTEKGINR